MNDHCWTSQRWHHFKIRESERTGSQNKGDFKNECAPVRRHRVNKWRCRRPVYFVGKIKFHVSPEHTNTYRPKHGLSDSANLHPSPILFSTPFFGKREEPRPATRSPAARGSQQAKKIHPPWLRRCRSRVSRRRGHVLKGHLRPREGLCCRGSG